MSKVETALHNDLQALQLLRDELRLQTHLLGADMRDRWQALETDWDRLKEHARRAQTAADDALPEIETAAALLVDALRRGYGDIRNALKA
ncbi:hypothetical protein [Solimonas soli]|uniref:hypothetical protein n=1 Tax=Solimonas soli TaxID=413479 RepID=UPI0004AFF8F9|nr:hypothetical protein [Solimonas soli]